MINLSLSFRAATRSSPSGWSGSASSSLASSLRALCILSWSYSPLRYAKLLPNTMICVCKEYVAAHATPQQRNSEAKFPKINRKKVNEKQLRNLTTTANPTEHWGNLKEICISRMENSHTHTQTNSIEQFYANQDTIFNHKQNVAQNCRQKCRKKKEKRKMLRIFICEDEDGEDKPLGSGGEDNLFW